MQLADLLAYNLYRAFKSEDHTYPYFQMLLPSFYRRPNGQTLDGLKVWPEGSPLIDAAREAWEAHKGKAPLRKGGALEMMSGWDDPSRAHQGHPTGQVSILVSCLATGISE